MRYHYESKNKTEVNSNDVLLYSCSHPLYKCCTLYKIGGRGLAVVQRKFNTKLKVSWWDCVESKLAYDILGQEGFKEFLEQKAEEPDQNGLYPTIGVRRLMWALRMKPLKREIWENEI